MRYVDGSPVRLGDIVQVPIPRGTAEARVVMLGDSQEHLALDENFVRWVKADKRLEPTSIVVQWLGANPFAHDDQEYAPVGDLLFSPVDESVLLVRRA